MLLSSFVSALKLDFKERFANMETIGGIILLIACLIGLFITFTHFEFVLHALAYLGFGFAAITACWWILVNRVKQKAVFDGHVITRKELENDWHMFIFYLWKGLKAILNIPLAFIKWFSKHVPNIKITVSTVTTPITPTSSPTTSEIPQAVSTTPTNTETNQGASNG